MNSKYLTPHEYNHYTEIVDGINERLDEINCLNNNSTIDDEDKLSIIAREDEINLMQQIISVYDILIKERELNSKKKPRKTNK